MKTKTSKIWLHGNQCVCERCTEYWHKATMFMVFDRHGEDFSDFEFPIHIGETVQLEDQHGGLYRLTYIGWKKPTN